MAKLNYKEVRKLLKEGREQRKPGKNLLQNVPADIFYKMLRDLKIKKKRVKEE